MAAEGKSEYVFGAVLVFSMISQMLQVVLNLNKHGTSSSPPH